MISIFLIYLPGGWVGIVCLETQHRLDGSGFKKSGGADHPHPSSMGLEDV